MSVGFLPQGKGKWGKGEESLDGDKPTYYYAGQELLEVSVVNIPANPNAIKKALEMRDEELRELREQPDEEEKSGDEAELAALRAEQERQLTLAEVALL